MARVLADAGWSLALGERDEARLQAVVDELGLPDDRVHAQVVDLLDLDNARAWADAAAAKLGGVHALVHLVGGWRGGEPIATAPVADDDFLHDVLVRSVQLTSRAFLPQLVEHAGRFVLVSSPQAERPSATNAAYGAAKAAAEAWTLALANELSGAGGTANIVRVNAIVTPQMRLDSPDRPFKSFTDAGEIAQAIEFLLSDAGRKMNGQRLSLHT